MPTYLYNGIELPSLPAWDKAKYPYAVITEGLVLNYGKYTLYCATNPIIESVNGAGSPTGYVCIDGDYIRAGYVGSDVESWGDFPAVTGTDKLLTNTPPLWTNTDIYYRNGSLYLAASDPVPVGGVPEPEPEETTALVSLYLPNNGAWVKHDIYKQVGNSWVKQPQGAVEVEGGAWSALS